MNQSSKGLLAPIAFFCFNCPDKTKMVLNALAKNDLAAESEIYIFCDGPRNIKDMLAIEQTRAVVDKATGFKAKHVFKKEINHGIKNSVIGGIGVVLEKHDSVIVVEDDILTSKNFLKFINEGLQFYRDCDYVWCVAGFNYPKNIITYPENYGEDVFFVKGRNCAWGWGIWKNRWNKIDFEVRDYAAFARDKNQIKAFNRAGSNMAEMLRFAIVGKVDTWDIQMSYSLFKHNGYTVHPLNTLVKNIGFDASGTHTTSNLDLINFEFEDSSEFKLKELADIANNDLVQNSFFKFHRDPFFLVRWARSKKKRRNFKWLLAGALLSELIHLLLF